MENKTFDATQYKSGQKEQWDSVAAGWEKWWPTMENIAQHVSQTLITQAGVQTGQTVLDIATGIGEPALALAKKVGTSGKVTAIDQSTEMLTIAKKRATKEGLKNISFEKVDGEQLDFTDAQFDAALCRWGLMFMPNVDTALHRIRRVIRPKGKFATAVWDSPERIPFYALAIQTLKQLFEVLAPPPEAPTISGLAEGVLEKKMLKADFKNIQTKAITVDFNLSSAALYAALMKDLAAPISALLASENPEAQKKYWLTLEENAARDFGNSEGGVSLPSVSICVVGEV